MSRFLDSCTEYLKNQPDAGNIIRVSELHNGGEPETAELVPASWCQNIYSVAKTFTMTAVGLLYDRGMLSPEDRFCDIFAEEIEKGNLWARGMDERWKLTTIDMALTHRIGLHGGFLDIDCNKISCFTDDFLAYTLTFPLISTPGEQYIYTDGAFYLCARAVEKKTGEHLNPFMWRELFQPLGFQEAAWSVCPQGHAVGGTGLYVHTADMVRLGQLYLSGGVWKGKRLLSEEWTKMAVERSYALDWDGSHTFYSKGGMYGQSLMVFPSQNRVLAVEGFDCDPYCVARFAMEYGDQD